MKKETYENSKSDIQEIKKTCCWVNEKKVLKEFLQRRITWMFILIFAVLVFLVKYNIHTDNKEYCKMLADVGQKFKPQEEIICNK